MPEPPDRRSWSIARAGRSAGPGHRAAALNLTSFCNPSRVRNTHGRHAKTDFRLDYGELSPNDVTIPLNPSKTAAPTPATTERWSGWPRGVLQPDSMAVATTLRVPASSRPWAACTR
jgi:hypothetical protein